MRSRGSEGEQEGKVGDVGRDQVDFFVEKDQVELTARIFAGPDSLDALAKATFKLNQLGNKFLRHLEEVPPGGDLKSCTSRSRAISWRIVSRHSSKLMMAFLSSTSRSLFS